MTQMCGIGPFITIPIMVATMGGPQAILGWLVGALLAITDGLVWAELGAAMPGAGGTYIYLREAFQYRTGKLMPFLFVWTAVLSIPLIMSTGIIGLVQYLGFYFPHMNWWTSHLIGIAVVVVIVAALYRRIESIRVLTTALWLVMLATVAVVIAACFSHFSADLAFTYPPGAFHLDHAFFAGLGAGLLIAVYDYLGYNTVAYLGDELKDPGRTMPRAIIYSIVGIMAIYLFLNVGVVGVVPWQQVAALGLRRVARGDDRMGPHGGGRRHRAHRRHGDRIGVRRPAGRLARAVQRRARPGLLRGLRPDAPAARLPAHRAAGHGRPHRRRIAARPDDRDQHADDGRGARTGDRTDHRADRVAPAPTGAAPPVPAVALSGAQHPGAGRMGVRVRVGRRPLDLALAVWIAGGLVAFLVWARVNRSWPFAPVRISESYLDEQRADEDAGRGHAHAVPS